MVKIPECTKNLYEMVSAICGDIHPFDYRSRCDRYCVYCHNMEGFFILAELETPGYGRTFRSIALDPVAFERLLSQALRDSLDSQRRSDTALSFTYRFDTNVLMDWETVRRLPEDDQAVRRAKRYPHLVQPVMHDTGQAVLVWLTLPLRGIPHDLLTWPLAHTRWQSVATRWIHERLPNIRLYQLELTEDFDPLGLEIESLPAVEGKCHIPLCRGATLVSVANLPSMTRLELLLDPCRQTEIGPLNTWYSSGTGMVLRIGNRTTWMMPKWSYFGKYSVPLLHHCVADQLAIASTIVGYTSLSLQEVAQLASTLWAHAGLRLGPLMVKSIVTTTSPILTTYLLETAENPAMLTGMLRSACRLRDRDLRYDHAYLYRRWKVSQRQLVSVVDLLRTQLGQPKLAESLEAYHAGTK